MQNIEFKPKQKTSTFRRFALATWKSPNDATMFGSHDVCVEKTLDYIEAFRQRTGKHLTFTHLVARGIAAGLHKYPETNVQVRAGAIQQRASTGVSLMVMKPNDRGTTDLSYATLFDLEKKPLEQIVSEADLEVTAARTNRSGRANAQNRFSKLPIPVLRASIRSLMFVTHTLNIDLSRFGVPKDLFGSVMVTNVGAFGLRTAYAPLVAETRIPMVITVGDVRESPWVENGKVVVRKVLRVNVSIDHRVMDASHASKLTHLLGEWLEDPAKMEGQPPYVVRAASSS